MDRFQEMQVFARIAERHSFSKAAEDLRIPPATVTNLIKRLEQRLGARLLERTTRQVRLTHDGEISTGAACACWPTWRKPTAPSWTRRPRACCE